MNYNEEQNLRIAYIEEIIRNYLPEEKGYQKTVLEAMNYSVLAGGKRIRPMLILETYRLFAKDNDKVLEPFIAAIEMIHTYSLVHDDLPAIDNDDYRRGRKTTHVVYGEAMAILAGDALLNYAYEVATRAFDLTEDTNRLLQVAKALKVLARKPGIYGMIGGQVVDVELTNSEIPKEKLNFIYELKTSALIEASMMIGAILAGANDKELLVVEEAARNIGLAFQIQDDILDVTSSVEVLGKPINSDEKNNKTTYVTIEGINKAQKDVEKMSKIAIDNLTSLNKENQFLFELIHKLINREK
ncbi:polyprenyl synthetase family protein [Anaeromicropila herbilytica]|uniref:Farnesyl diphosphate synthase n=1 Tax=Anaeromicropila herbilytica TaxID=2785025 RepID=A0A7R7EKF3_9FIRM|nr:farnesyl diphosphate synthase [Anaeromicropila herbilytica]BCN30403.1 farnesyl-diphosphate synthase [Anaeromicropila herbilytica]